MAERNAGVIETDIGIVGGGIAGLWLHAHLRAAGYNCVLAERDALGGGQSIASQGIIHSGLKYALAGKVNDLAREISAMPERWRAALRGEGPVDLSAARAAADSQKLLIPPGFMGSLVKVATQKTLGNVSALPREAWPKELVQTGFSGSVIDMNELVLDIPSVIRALGAPHAATIRRGGAENIRARLMIHTAAVGNLGAARANGDDERLETQARPLLMAMMAGAPFDLFAHCIGASDKPVATITTHFTVNGERVWYFGGAVAERAKESDPAACIAAAQEALKKYLPRLELHGMRWAVLPIDRIEGKSGPAGWMPDTPTLHGHAVRLYAWPTKLTFAPLLADMVMERVATAGITPSRRTADCSDLPAVDYAAPPWDKVQWTKDPSAIQA